MSVKVQRPVLPPPQQWSFRLDLWQNPWVVARYYDLEPWSDQHKALLERHLKLYAEAGGKYITTYAIDSPWKYSRSQGATHPECGRRLLAFRSCRSIFRL